MAAYTTSQPNSDSFEALQAWAGDGRGAVALVGEGAASRGLVTTRAITAGEIVVELPWRCAFSVKTAIRRLKGDEVASRGLLPGGFQRVLQLVQAGTSDLLPPALGWVLLLALQLLSELRDPCSPWAPYLKLLPSPPGRRLKAVCCHGPDATDLLLFRRTELEELQCAPLMAATLKERQRLAQLHQLLFGRTDEGPSISLETFIWAHCLVRSRALDLMASTDAATPEAKGSFLFRAQCLLPIIDLCNHDSIGKMCTLTVQETLEGKRVVQLIAARDFGAGEEITLNYGTRPMRDLLRGYGFVPANAAFTSPLEVFEDVGGPTFALVVHGSPQGSMFHLAEAHILAQAGDDVLLELSCASIVFIVKDDGVASQSYFTPPSVTRSQSQLAAVGEHPGVEPPTHLMSPDTERDLCGFLVHCCEGAMSDMQTSSEEDMQLLDCPSPSVNMKEDKAWFERVHLCMAIQYRLERKRLLERVITDLQCHQQMIFMQQPSASVISAIYLSTVAHRQSLALQPKRFGNHK